MGRSVGFDVLVSGNFRFGESVLFHGLDLPLRCASWTCLVGASGTGKSTILRLIADLQTTGLFDGNIITSDAKPISGRVSYMAQSDLLMPWLTVKQNVALGHRLRNESLNDNVIDQIIDQVGLSGHEHKKPPALSGGMRQRAALARTLVEDTPLVLLDEPFSALDVKTRSRMQELAFEKLRDRTVLLVTHDPAEAIRMGHHLYEITPTSLITHPLPPTAPIRAVDDSAVLRCQASLLKSLGV